MLVGRCGGRSGSVCTASMSTMLPRWRASWTRRAACASPSPEPRGPERRARKGTVMAFVDLRRDGDVFVLTMCDGENRFNRPSVDAWNAALDTVEASSGPAALVTTGTDKFFSNG